jgi:WD40 repeat protein
VIHRRRVIGLAVDPTASRMVSASDARAAYERELAEPSEPGVHVWELATGRHLAQLGDTEVQAMASTRDVTVVAAIDPTGIATVWRVATGERIGRLALGDRVRWIGLDAGGATLYAATRSGQVTHWDIATARVVARVEIGFAVSAAAGTASGLIAVGGEDGALAVVDLVRGAPPRRIATGRGDLTAIDLDDDGGLVAAIDDSGGGVWSVATGSLVARLALGGQALRLIDRGRRVVVSGPHQGEQLAVITLTTGAMAVLDGFSGHALALAELPGQRLLAGTWDGPVRLFDLATGQDAQRALGHTTWIQVLGFTSDGDVVASAGAFGPERTLRWPIARRSSPRVAPAPSIVEPVVIALSTAGRARAWFDASKGQLGAEANLAGAAARSWSSEYAPGHASISANEQILAAMTSDETTGTEIATYALVTGGEHHWTLPAPAFMQQLGVSHDGALISLGGDSIALYDATRGHLVHTLVDHALNVAELAFDARDRWLVTASESDGLQVWNPATGQLQRTLYPGERGKRQGSGNTAYCAAISPDGTLVASGHRDGSVRLWQLASGRLLATEARHRGLVGRAAFSPDGRQLATGDRHGQIYVWPVTP